MEIMLLSLSGWEIGITDPIPGAIWTETVIGRLLKPVSQKAGFLPTLTGMVL